MNLNWLSIAVALTGVLSSGVVGYLAFSLSKQNQRSSVQRSIEDLYEHLMEFRSLHPEVLKLSSQWSVDCFARVYRQSNAGDRQWALYYTYAELSLGFCNSVLYGRKVRALDRAVFNGYYQPLLKMVLTEHYPFLASALDGPYISRLVRDFVRELEKAGWNWTQRRSALIGRPARKPD
jgi:hypothetical protein